MQACGVNLNLNLKLNLKSGLAQDLDPALLSRFDASVTFGLPSEECRRQILRQYARHLPEAAVTALAADAEGMSGRDLRDVAEQAERRWASKAC